MNKFKIEVKEILKKYYFVDAESNEEALKYMENNLIKSNVLDLGAKDIEAVEIKILEKNGEKIDRDVFSILEEDNNEELYITREQIELQNCKERLKKLNKLLIELMENLDEIDINSEIIRDILLDNYDVNLE